MSGDNVDCCGEHAIDCECSKPNSKEIIIPIHPALQYAIVGHCGSKKLLQIIETAKEIECEYRTMKNAMV